MRAGHKHAPSILRLETSMVAKRRDKIGERKLTIISAEYRGRAVAALSSSAQPRVEGITKAAGKIEVVN
jgi:hypothetical protein